MHYLVTVQRTSMGVRINLPTVHFEREILRWAEERLHAPKMGKENGRITTERGDPYYAHMPTERSFSSATTGSGSTSLEPYFSGLTWVGSDSSVTTRLVPSVVMK